MRWDALFGDLELQIEATEAQGWAREVADLTRAERASIQLLDRLRGSAGSEVRIMLRSGSVNGTLSDVGAGWLLIRDARERLIPMQAITGIGGLGVASAPEPSLVIRRLGLGHALRAIARDRGVVEVSVGAARLSGRIDAVGADHLDLALIQDSARPTGELTVVPFAALDLVSSV